MLIRWRISATTLSGGMAIGYNKYTDSVAISFNQCVIDEGWGETFFNEKGS